MRSTAAQTLRTLRRGAPTAPSSHLLQTIRPTTRIPLPTQYRHTFHTYPSLQTKPQRSQRPSDPPQPATSKTRAHNNEPVPEQAPPTDFAQLDVLGNTPAPANSVDICMWDGFALNNGARIFDGSGVLLVGGEAFRWRPWEDGGKRGGRLVNKKGQWDVDTGVFGLLGLVWPRPDLLILGLGPGILPISPEVKKHITSLGMRVEILDTRNAASQFNMLATERGAGEVAAALIPIGRREPPA